MSKSYDTMDGNVPTRPTRFETEEEFLSNYNDFLKSSEQPSATVCYRSQQDDAESSTASLGETPTSDLLPAIKERKVLPRRRRRYPVANAPFPSIPYVQSHNSVFARRSAEPNLRRNAPDNATPQLAKKVPESVNGPPNSSNQNNVSAPSDSARAAISNMSEEEIAMAQRELLSQLKPDSVAFLQERWKSRDLGHFSNDVVHSETRNASNGTAILSNNTSASNASDIDFTVVKNDQTNSAPLSIANTSRNDLSNSEIVNIRESLIINESPPTAEESEKMLWMTDATTPLPSDAELDELFKKAVDSMGPIGEKRFDLEGHILTLEQVHTLPTHLGLHHHGSSPADAGYTLSDVLTLLRSTAVPQRVAALRIFTAILSRHGRTVSDALVTSGALSIAFAPFPSPSTFYSSLTNQMVYVDTIHALMLPYLASFPAGNTLVSSLFFASHFYAAQWLSNDASIFQVLARTDCVITLTRIAYSTISVPEGLRLSTLALRLLRSLVLESEEACRKLAEDQDTIALLHAMCTEFNRGEITLVTCDIIAHVVIGIGWDRDRSAAMLKDSILNEVFLRKICNSLALVVRDDINVIAKEQILCASGAIRIFRAALTFQLGPSLFSGLTQAVCCMLYEGDIVAAEVYLTLEAYVHCLHENVVSQSEKQNSAKRGCKKGSGTQVKGKTCLSDLFVMDQISGLVPVALAAIRCFTSEKSEKSEYVKAAAGHFAATLFAVYRIPFDQSSIALVLSTCTTASKQLLNLCSHSDLPKMQAVSSMSHAGARLLTRVQMEAAYVKCEVDLILRAVKLENEVSLKTDRPLSWRPIANACAEWLGLLSNTQCSVLSVKYATELLPMLRDAQVAIDVISRCVLRVEALCVLDDTLTIDEARKCASDLLPPTYDGLCDIYKAAGSDEDQKSKSVTSMMSVLKMWSDNVDCIPSFTRVVSVFVSAKILNATDMLELIICVPLQKSKRHAGECFKLLHLLATQIISRGDKLFADKSSTVVSSVSTMPNPALANAIMDLADHLVERGPIYEEAAKNGNSCDPLASFLLTLIFRDDADLSLRIFLWRLTVDNCGSAMLYAGGSQISPTHREINVNEEFQLVYTLINSFSHGFLGTNRCPLAVENAIVEKLECALSEGMDIDVVHEALESVQERDSSSVYKAITVVVENAANR